MSSIRSPVSSIPTDNRSKFKGAGAAAQATDPYDGLRDSLNTLSESMGGIINKALIPAIDWLAKMADKFNALSPAAQRFIVIGAS